MHWRTTRALHEARAVHARDEHELAEVHQRLHGDDFEPEHVLAEPGVQTGEAGHHPGQVVHVHVRQARQDHARNRNQSNTNVIPSVYIIL